MNKNPFRTSLRLQSILAVPSVSFPRHRSCSYASFETLTDGPHYNGFRYRREIRNGF